ncbi:hypothetical protein D3C84_1259740 [compost metagenome]
MAICARILKHLLEQGSVFARLCADRNLLVPPQITTLFGEHDHAIPVGVQIVQIGMNHGMNLIGQRRSGVLRYLA